MKDNHPQIFISYCRHPEENFQRTVALAERLTRAGVYVMLDVWDLKTGQDKNVYMEKMVTDPDMDKVLLICNKDYVERANQRKGGVGIESTIISSELYSKTDQTKFIPIIFGMDEKGEAYVPVYAKSLTYIDMSSDEVYEEGYDQLLRDIYDKQRMTRPPIGAMPSYLAVKTPSYLPTAGMVESIRRALDSQNPRTSHLVETYLETFVNSIPSYKLDGSTLREYNLIETVEQSIEALQSVKNDFISFLQTIAKEPVCTSSLFVDFFEKLLQTYENSGIQLEEGQDIMSLSYDNIRFFNYELFLSFAVVMIDNDRFDILAEIVKTKFCIISTSRINQLTTKTYRRFQPYVYTLNYYKKSWTNSNRVSLKADLVKQNTTVLNFDSLVKADILLYYLSLVYPITDDILENYWYPDMSIYQRFVEIYPLLASKRFFDKFKVLFGVETAEEFRNLIVNVKEPDIREGFHRIPPIKEGLSLRSVASVN